MYTHTVLPGPPNILLISKSSESLNIQIQLSNIGTAPILEVYSNITDSSHLVNSLDWAGYFTQGELINVQVTNLQPNTLYIIMAYAVNSEGRGNLSMDFMFATGMNMHLGSALFFVCPFLVAILTCCMYLSKQLSYCVFTGTYV